MAKGVLLNLALGTYLPRLFSLNYLVVLGAANVQQSAPNTLRQYFETWNVQ